VHRLKVLKTPKQKEQSKRLLRTTQLHWMNVLGEWLVCVYKERGSIQHRKHLIHKSVTASNHNTLEERTVLRHLEKCFSMRNEQTSKMSLLCHKLKMFKFIVVQSEDCAKENKNILFQPQRRAPKIKYLWRQRSCIKKILQVQHEIRAPYNANETRGP